jgi:hypothetical protein
VRKLGRDIWGLGPILYVDNGAGDFIIGHDGQNAPAINTTARLNPTTGDGIVVLTTGKGTLASEIGGEWVYWQTGRAGLVTLASHTGRIITLAVSGCAVIVVGCVWFLWSGWRRPRSRG